MSKIIGLDVGTKRVGVAIGDTETKFAAPLETFDRAQGRAEKRILELQGREEPSLVVVGLPVNDDGSLNDQCLLVLAFCRRLKRRLNVPLVYVDEYLTSLESQEILGLSGRRERAQRAAGSVDAMAAALILRSYLETGVVITVPEESPSSEPRGSNRTGSR